MENNSRKLNLEITGIPAVADENCKKLVYTLDKLIQVDDEHLKNIDVAHRLTNSNGEILAIIVKFKSRTDRDKYFERRFSLKDKNIETLGLKKSQLTENQHHKIYINESLSVFTKLLFRKTRDTC